MRLFNLFKKDWDFEVDFVFGQRGTQIEENYTEISDKVRVLSTLSLIVRFFGICDQRQIEPMNNYLKNLFENKIAFEEDKHSKGFYSHNQFWWDIYTTLNTPEKRAVDKLFGVHTMVIYLNTNEIKTGVAYSNYKYFWSYNNGQPQDKLKLSSGADKVLLPLMVSMFINSNSIQLQKIESKKQLGNLGLSLLHQINCVRPSPKTARDIINNIGRQI